MGQCQPIQRSIKTFCPLPLHCNIELYFFILREHSNLDTFLSLDRLTVCCRPFVYMYYRMFLRGGAFFFGIVLRRIHRSIVCFFSVFAIPLYHLRNSHSAGFPRGV